MPRPVVTPTTEEIYVALRPIVVQDEATDWVSLRIAESVGRQLDEVEALSRDSDVGPGWSAILDPNRAPVAYLPWLAQMVGVAFVGTLTEVQQRQRIEDQEGRRRGTRAAIEAAAKKTLTGGQQVFIYEKWGGDAYTLRVVTYTAETPDPAATEAAIRRQKPAGIVLIYEVVTAGTIDALAGTVDSQPGTIDSLG